MAVVNSRGLFAFGVGDGIVSVNAFGQDKPLIVSTGSGPGTAAGGVKFLTDDELVYQVDEPAIKRSWLQAYHTVTGVYRPIDEDEGASAITAGRGFGAFYVQSGTFRTRTTRGWHVDGWHPHSIGADDTVLMGNFNNDRLRIYDFAGNLVKSEDQLHQGPVLEACHLAADDVFWSSGPALLFRNGGQIPLAVMGGLFKPFIGPDGRLWICYQGQNGGAVACPVDDTSSGVHLRQKLNAYTPAAVTVKGHLQIGYSISSSEFPQFQEVHEVTTFTHLEEPVIIVAPDRPAAIGPMYATSARYGAMNGSWNVEVVLDASDEQIAGILKTQRQFIIGSSLLPKFPLDRVVGFYCAASPGVTLEQEIDHLNPIARTTGKCLVVYDDQRPFRDDLVRAHAHVPFVRAPQCYRNIKLQPDGRKVIDETMPAFEVFVRGEVERLASLGDEPIWLLWGMDDRQMALTTRDLRDQWALFSRLLHDNQKIMGAGLFSLLRSGPAVDPVTKQPTGGSQGGMIAHPETIDDVDELMKGVTGLPPFPTAKVPTPKPTDPGPSQPTEPSHPPTTTNEGDDDMAFKLPPVVSLKKAGHGFLNVNPNPGPLFGKTASDKPTVGDHERFNLAQHPDGRYLATHLASKLNWSLDSSGEEMAKADTGDDQLAILGGGCILTFVNRYQGKLLIQSYEVCDEHGQPLPFQTTLRK